MNTMIIKNETKKKKKTETESWDFPSLVAKTLDKI